MMDYLDDRWRRQSLVYFGEPQDSSANVAVRLCLSGASRVCSRAATPHERSPRTVMMNSEFGGHLFDSLCTQRPVSIVSR